MGCTNEPACTKFYLYKVHKIKQLAFKIYCHGVEMSSSTLYNSYMPAGTYGNAQLGTHGNDQLIYIMLQSTEVAKLITIAFNKYFASLLINKFFSHPQAKTLNKPAIKISFNTV